MQDDQARLEAETIIAKITTIADQSALRLEIDGIIMTVHTAHALLDIKRRHQTFTEGVARQMMDMGAVHPRGMIMGTLRNIHRRIHNIRPHPVT
jgi:hypothetical protein